MSTPCEIPIKVLEEVNKLLEPHRNKIVGLVLRDWDTANVEIVALETLFDNSKVQNRMLVVSEFQELMNPTKSCVQLGMQTFIKAINTPHRH